MLNIYEHLDQQILDRKTQFLKEAEQEALRKVAREANSPAGKEYHSAARLSLRQRLSVLLMS